MNTVKFVFCILISQFNCNYNYACEFFFPKTIIFYLFQHLENTIQELQRRVLEEQEKLAVAVKVDEGKDKAIAQITEAWKQMVNHWRDIESDRHAMSQAVIKERAVMKQAHEEMNKVNII